MGMMSEFKEFAVKGNVVDMAVGLVLGAAFGKIVTSFVSGVVMPALSPLMGGVNFKDMKHIMTEAVMNADGTVATPAVAIEYGAFFDTIFQFIVIAFAIFMVIRQMNKLKKKEEAKEEAPAGPSAEDLLTEIRDALKK